MNGLIHEHILFSAPADCFKIPFSSDIDLLPRRQASCKGYVSRKDSAHFLFGWSPRHQLWYYLCPRWDTTAYCYRCYFKLVDRTHDKTLTIDDLSLVKIAFNADASIVE